MKNSKSTVRQAKQTGNLSRLVVLLIFVISVFALIIKGDVILTPKGIAISTKIDTDIRRQKLSQVSSADGVNAVSVNAIGSVNIGTTSPRTSRDLLGDVDQRATALGNGARAMNSGADINIK